MKPQKLILISSFILLIFFNTITMVFAGPKTNKPNYLAADYWKQQALKEIIPFWIPTVDQKNGGYYTDVNRNGFIQQKSPKYPRMISRLVYGFSAAYLLSGNEKYLILARHGLDYLAKYGWDKEYGGWYAELDNKNKATIGIKDLFDETYGNVGPIFYYYATGDPGALELVKKTHDLIRRKAWDNQYRGYFGAVNRDWSVSGTDKSFNAEIDTATAYLIYYYLATKNQALLQDLKDIAAVATEHMYDQKTGYIREQFTQEWNFINNYLGPDQIDIGHNLKTAWVMLRIYQLTGETKYFDFAKSLAAKMLETGWDDQYSGWFFCKNINRPAGTPREKSKCWWTQTEGNFMLINLFNLTRDSSYLDVYQKNALFWDTFFVDHRSKEVYSYTAQDGTCTDPSKGNLYKSAYHSMENALMNYLYLQLYVHKTTAELYFNLSAASDGVIHYVKIIESPAVIIKKVEINGADWRRFNSKEGYVALPKGKNMKVKVVFGVN